MEVEVEVLKRRAGIHKKDQEENQRVEDSFSDSDKLVAGAKLSISIDEASKR